MPANAMQIAILTFEGFNELDSLIALNILNRIKRPDWKVSLCCPQPQVTSMNGLTVGAQSLLDDIQFHNRVGPATGTPGRLGAKYPSLWVTNGGGGMPAFAGTLSEEEIANVAAYVVEDIVGGK